MPQLLNRGIAATIVPTGTKTVNNSYTATRLTFASFHTVRNTVSDILANNSHLGLFAGGHFCKSPRSRPTDYLRLRVKSEQVNRQQT